MLQADLGPSQTSIMENSQRDLAVIYSCKKAPSLMFQSVLNMYLGCFDYAITNSLRTRRIINYTLCKYARIQFFSDSHFTV